MSDYDFVVTYQDYRDELEYNKEVDQLNAELDGQTDGIEQPPTDTAGSPTDPAILSPDSEPSLQQQYYEKFDLFREFDDLHFMQRTVGAEEPYRYGSYLVYEQDDRYKHYKVINYVNTTSQDVAAAYPQFMYEAILRQATGYDYFTFKLVTEPFPIMQKYKDEEKQTSVIQLLFVTSVGLSLLPGLIVGAIMHEREHSLKHMQVISGMNLKAYWLVNIAFDIFKMQLPMIIICLLLFVFQLKEYYSSIFIFMAFPLGVVPFTHACSFLFQTEWSAQFFTVGLNLSVMIFGPLTVYIFMFVSEDPTSVLFGQWLNRFLRIVPSYNVSKTLLFCGTKSILFRKLNTEGLNFPQEIELERWTYEN